MVVICQRGGGLGGGGKRNMNLYAMIMFCVRMEAAYIIYLVVDYL